MNSVIICMIENYYIFLFGTKIANDEQEGKVMNLLTALFKILVWVARSVALVLAVLFLSALLMLGHKQ
jgi:hypothetical protein